MLEGHTQPSHDPSQDETRPSEPHTDDHPPAPEPEKPQGVACASDLWQVDESCPRYLYFQLCKKWSYSCREAVLCSKQCAVINNNIPRES